jgi:hypothetical protein
MYWLIGTGPSKLDLLDYLLLLLLPSNLLEPSFNSAINVLRDHF